MRDLKTPLQKIGYLKTEEINSEIGQTILEAIAKLRFEHEEYYRKASCKQYKRKEAEYIKEALTTLEYKTTPESDNRKEEGTAPLKEQYQYSEIAAEYGSTAHIFNINFLIDAALFLFSRHREREDIALFFGKTLEQVLNERHVLSEEKQYHRRSEDRTYQEYVKFLESVKKHIRKEFNLKL